jgi:ribosome biogenesis GTPase / thiamine phosphate phosphatase
MSLQQLGWSAFFQAFWGERPLRPARVISQGGDRVLVHDGSGELQATVRGRLREQASFPPVVGDWVGLSPRDPGQPAADSGVIEEILERRTVIARKRPGKTFGAQVLAANIDRVVLLMALDQDFSVHRLERYLTLVWESAATPIIVLSKADLAEDPSSFVCLAEERAMGFPVITLSNVSGRGREALGSLLRAEETIVLLGSSGAGKSTLINGLGGAALRRTAAVRLSDGKGRHTTTDRHLVRLPSGVLVIDTPGLREVQLWAEEDSLQQTFAEIAEAAAGCRFRDCRHVGEPGCAVAAALHRGEIIADRLRSFHQLRAEIERLERESDPRLVSEYKSEIKKIHRAQKQKYKMSRKR